MSVSAGIEEAARDADVIIDFTVPEATLAHAEYSVRNGKSMVIGTTGFSRSRGKSSSGCFGGYRASSLPT